MRTDVAEVSTPLGLWTIIEAMGEPGPDVRRMLLLAMISRDPEVESWLRDDEPA